ncbi:MAG TPA: GNAT family N-acetyltransferase [Pseudobacteroides sp.]|uniref:GNAT family N-acetyltransferase n=1 Tax=Pseudobacteroides sp. TaxID=1968840 RepID=UPI002F938EC5
MRIRLATMEDLNAITKVEAICFPQAEAATKESFRKRLEIFPNHFWLLEDKGQIVSIVNGMATDLEILQDAMFEDASMHDENGAWQMIFGAETVPNYRRQGCMERLMKHVIEEVRSQGRKGLVLTCKEGLVHYYEKFGFVSEGKSESSHGGATWFNMRLSF